MDITTVTVSGQINKQDGKPAALTKVRFVLSAIGIVGLAMVLPKYVDITCDASGTFSAQVMSNPAGTYYTVTISPTNGLPISMRAVVPAADCQFSQILQDLPAENIGYAQRALLDLQAAQAEINTQVSFNQSAIILITAKTDQSVAAALAANTSAIDSNTSAVISFNKSELSNISADASQTSANLSGGFKDSAALSAAAAQTSADSFAINFAQLATSLINTQNIVAQHHGFN
jgi:hypothetical protein